MKIVYSAGSGGFSISKEALEWMALRGHSYAAKEVLAISESYGSLYAGLEIDRDDPLLIEAIETLGSEVVSGFFALLSIADIPDGVEWEIDERNGYEEVVPPRMRWPEKEAV